MIQVYYGNGKGKTSAALGLAMRAAGHGLNVLIIQFLKSSPTGELNSLSRIENIRILRGKAGGFIMTDVEKAETKKIHDLNLKLACESVFGGGCDVLILDECMDALLMGLLDEETLRNLVNNCPAGMELVITGHKPVGWILDAADYVTEMAKRKHPFDNGTPARPGIEY